MICGISIRRAAPILFDASRNGRTVPAVAQITKMGILFAFDRVTGKPLYGMEERPVPQSTVPRREDSSDPAISAEAAAALTRRVHERRNVQSHAGARGFLSRPLRTQSNANQPALHSCSGSKEMC